MPEYDEITRVAALFKLLGDPTRTRLLYTLLDAGELYVSDLALATGTGESTVSQALRLLRASGVVTGRRDGRVLGVRDQAGGRPPGPHRAARTVPPARPIRCPSTLFAACRADPRHPTNRRRKMSSSLQWSSPKIGRDTSTIYRDTTAFKASPLWAYGSRSSLPAIHGGPSGTTRRPRVSQ